MQPEDLQHRFDYHPPKSPETVTAHENVRSFCRHMALSFNEMLPEGREKALAVTKLEEVMFWANAAVARAGTEAR